VRAVVAQLRSPDGGCPWDLEQTHQTLRRYLVEEAYEALDAIDAGEPRRLSEELGDLLMQVVLHAQVAEDNGEFTIEDVFASIASKLIRRHPHVFGELQVEGAEDVLRNWETLKKEERGDEPLLDHVPTSMPALMQAQSVQSRAEKAGLAPRRARDATMVESIRALSGSGADASPETLGELLMGIVQLARARGLDAEDALRSSIRRYRDEVARSESTQRSVS
jgi:tetrapyrrole methylase family protein/MazG family protein